MGLLEGAPSGGVAGAISAAFGSLLRFRHQRYAARALRRAVTCSLWSELFPGGDRFCCFRNSRSRIVEQQRQIRHGKAARFIGGEGSTGKGAGRSSGRLRQRDHRWRSLWSAPGTISRCATLYGATLWATADEVAVPALGLSEPASEYPAAIHLQALASHLVYGVATWEAVRAIRSVW
jgi:hypothetical protein